MAFRDARIRVSQAASQQLNGALRLITLPSLRNLGSASRFRLPSPFVAFRVRRLRLLPSSSPHRNTRTQHILAMQEMGPTPMKTSAATSLGKDCATCSDDSSTKRYASRGGLIAENLCKLDMAEEVHLPPRRRQRVSAFGWATPVAAQPVPHTMLSTRPTPYAARQIRLPRL